MLLKNTIGFVFSSLCRLRSVCPRWWHTTGSVTGRPRGQPRRQAVGIASHRGGARVLGADLADAVGDLVRVELPVVGGGHPATHELQDVEVAEELPSLTPIKP